MIMNPTITELKQGKNAKMVTGTLTNSGQSITFNIGFKPSAFIWGTQFSRVDYSDIDRIVGGVSPNGTICYLTPTPTTSVAVDASYNSSTGVLTIPCNRLIYSAFVTNYYCIAMADL